MVPGCSFLKRRLSALSAAEDVLRAGTHDSQYAPPSQLWKVIGRSSRQARGSQVFLQQVLPNLKRKRAEGTSVRRVPFHPYKEAPWISVSETSGP